MWRMMMGVWRPNAWAMLAVSALVPATMTRHSAARDQAGRVRLTHVAVLLVAHHSTGEIERQTERHAVPPLRSAAIVRQLECQPGNAENGAVYEAVNYSRC